MWQGRLQGFLCKINISRKVMGKEFRRKLFNDPVYGFITITDSLWFRVIEHPAFQRLRRISQLGHASLVYPGALHTRFHHALGALHLMQKALAVLRSKGIEISGSEFQAACLAILLHDMGHGPFSHALERVIVPAVPHEKLSAIFMQQMDAEFGGGLELALAIFQDRYPRKFFHQLVSGQLDMDRMDYLMRDSFYTGVSEGLINTERILAMLDVQDGELVIEAKGVYSVEKFLMARKLMFWQVYYHKTVLSAECMMVQVVRRARFLVQQGEKMPCSPALFYFLGQSPSLADFEDHGTAFSHFALLDDHDLMSALKLWTTHPDPVLSLLSQGIVHRKLFRGSLLAEKPGEGQIAKIIQGIVARTGLQTEAAQWLLIQSELPPVVSADEQSIRIKTGVSPHPAGPGYLGNIYQAIGSSPDYRHFMALPKE